MSLPESSSRVADIRPFRVMQVLARARELEAAGRHLVHMEIGEPDFATAPPVVAAGREALQQGLTHYSPAPGLPQLRQAIADYYRDQRGVSVAPSRIVVTTGASGALQLALGLILDPGQTLLVTDPGYPCYRNFALFLGARAHTLPVTAVAGWQPDVHSVASAMTDDTRALLLASPANPTGAVIPAAELERLASCLAARQSWLVVDEIYHGLSYTGALPSALNAGDNVIVVDSFSKYFGMTGWRIGWLVLPESLVEAADRVQQNLSICAPVPAQHAALAALGSDAMAIHEQRREAFCARRDVLLPGLRELGFSIPVTPAGAFYLYADCAALSDNSEVLARDLLEEAGVAITPGADFGDHRAGQHVRFAYTTGLEAIDDGLERMRRFLRAGGG